MKIAERWRKLNNSSVQIFVFSARNEQILPNFHFILPKFHFILPKFYFAPPWRLFICSVKISDFLGTGVAVSCRLVLLEPLVPLEESL